MARIFSVLALIAVSLLSINLILGLMIGDYGGVARERVAAGQQVRQLTKTPSVAEEELQAARQQMLGVMERFQPVKQRATLHVLLGVTAALITILVNSIAITYFIGTTRWCREVVDAYRLSPTLAERSEALKRRTFPCAIGGFFVILTIVALGAASDPGGANFHNTASWVTPHLLAALAGTALIGWSFLVQFNNISANYRVIEEIVGHVQQIRAERGLDVEGS